MWFGKIVVEAILLGAKLQLVDASEFIQGYNEHKVVYHDQLRLNNSGQGNNTYLIKAGIGFGLDTLVLRGTVIIGSNGSVVGRENAEFRISRGVFLRKETHQFVTMSSGFQSEPMYFDINPDGTWGSVEGGKFREGKLFHLRNVTEKRNDFDAENFGFMGGHCDVPLSVEVLFRGLGYIALVPVGDTVKSLIDAYAKRLVGVSQNV